VLGRNLIVPDEADKELIYINFKPKHLSKVTSKEIRLSRTDCEPVCIFKTGTILTPFESINYFHSLNRLTAVRHKNILLRILHGDIYTKDRQFRFGLADSPTCPRCDEVETIEHKFVTCSYISRIWQSADSLTGHRTDLTIDLIQDRLLANSNGDINPEHVNLIIHSEILNRILHLRADADYLIRPKIFVKNTLMYLAKKEKDSKVKTSISNLLSNLLSD
jgi:hypothetical protein